MYNLGDGKHFFRKMKSIRHKGKADRPEGETSCTIFLSVKEVASLGCTPREFPILRDVVTLSSK